MKKLILFLCFLSIVGCGYKPIFSNKGANFSIDKIEYNKNKLNKIIYNNLSSYQNAKDKEYIYNIEIFTSDNKTVISKDSKGNPSNFRLNISVNFKVFESKKLIFTKIYEEKFDYPNTSKKFELNQYEDELRKSILNQVSDRIIKNLFMIK